MAKSKKTKTVNNKATIRSEQQSQDDMLKQSNAYEDYISTYVEGYISKLFNDGIIKTVNAEQLRDWFANPDTYYKEISDLMTYYYISDGDIYQLYNLIYTLPTLNYKINVFDTEKKYEKNLSTINKALYKVKYKSLIRDLLSQEVSKGTVVCIWLGDKKNPYLFIFDDLKYVFPKYRRNGEWVCVIDMEWFKNMKDEERNSYFETLSPYATEKMYKDFLNNPQKNRYLELPQDRTHCLRINTLMRNQRLGLPMGTQSMFDKLHKQSLKNMETAIANKIIKNVAVVKIGSDKNESYANAKLNPNVKKKIHANVKRALSQNIENGIAIITVPEYVDIDFGSKTMNGLEGLKGEKFEAVDDSITNATGVSKGLTNGSGGNFATVKLNLNILYKRIGIMLEGIEEVFEKLIKIILPSNLADEYYIEFDKSEPLTTKEKLDVLMRLHNMEGFSLKYVIDELHGVEWDSYIKQSLYEQESMKIQDRIKPYASAYTGGSADKTNGRPNDESNENENTVKSKEYDGNNMPRAGD